ncbi:hypothetical protein DFH08DRAFT_1021710 [Mycena albidolilacea]|uniref:Uncharacterized protein n=1 Tax=Mycena albidolilacea TaxID=1033008 RepID=A0AAD7ELA3_9AGAR|nr:hypothetical protein DFH08DRAFT_1021710 [Mycena albidolilacea]
MLPATHGLASGTGPPARRSLLGSSRAQKEQQQPSGNFGLGEGGALLNGTATAHGNGNALARNALGNGHGSTSTVPQKRKLGISAGAGGSNVRHDEDGGGMRERRREGDRGKVISLDMIMSFDDRAGGGGNGEGGDEIRCCCGASADDIRENLPRYFAENILWPPKFRYFWQILSNLIGILAKVLALLHILWSPDIILLILHTKL